MRKGSVSVAEFRPDLIEQWDPSNEKGPHEMARGSGKKVKWIGPCGHKWEAAVDNRCYGNSGCPFCTTRGWKRVKSGLNDLATRFPEVARQWHPTLNGEITPDKVLPGVKERYWWLCGDCGREWKALLNMRTSRGTGCPSCRGRKRGVQVSGTTHWAELFSEWSDKNTLQLKDFSVSSQHRAHWICKNGHEYRASIGDRNLKQTRCKQCGNGGSSAGEREVADFIQSLGVGVRSHHRQINPAFEYDVTVPKLKIAVEYNGVYWHSERHKPNQDYHQKKTRAAQTAGWGVIHVWEDDWNDRKEIVKRLLARKLGVSDEPKFNARSLTVEKVSSKDAREFLDANHIQGFTVGSLYLALKDRDGIRALVTFKKTQVPGEFRLDRFATDGIVRGGFTRLLKNGIEILNATRIVTFSDNTNSSGELYEKSGFTRDGEIAPDYMYVVGSRREHKFNYRKDRFRRDPNLKYEEGLSERELAALNGLERIWDAGKVRWALDVK